VTVETSLPGERHGHGTGAGADIARSPYPPSQQHHPSDVVTVPAAHRTSVAVESAGAPAPVAPPIEPDQIDREPQSDVERFAEAVGDRFRLPAADDPEPSPRYLIGVSVWAALLGLGGIAVGLRALIGMLATDTSWYTPTVVAIGTAGLVATIGAFASVHRRRMPWLMLGVATTALLADWYLTGAA
jgi:hypothetical protein